MRPVMRYVLLTPNPATGRYAARFDGSNDYLVRTSTLSGAVDDSKLTIAALLKFTGGDASVVRILRNGAGTVTFLRDASNRVQVQVKDNTAASSLTVISSGVTVSSALGWAAILFSCDCNAPAGSKAANLYINDVSRKGTATDASAAFNINISDTSWGALASPDGTNKVQADVSFIWMASGITLDFSIAANRRLFFDADGLPAQLGVNGSAPGVVPLLYSAVFNGRPDPASFGMNHGSGGDFSLVGGLDSAAGPLG